MTSGLKRSLALVAVLALLVGVFTAGMAVGTRLTRGELGELILVGWRSQTAFLQYQEAQDDAAEQALLEFIDIVRRLPRANDRIITETSVAADVTLSYVRLSNVRNRRGDEAQARKYLVQAQDACRAAAWKDCSEQHLREVVGRIDNNVATTAK